jgi:hypothetical protein
MYPVVIDGTRPDPTRPDIPSGIPIIGIALSRQGDSKLKSTMDFIIREAYRVWGANLVIFSAQLDKKLVVRLDV